MSKQLDVSGISNELSGSAFFSQTPPPAKRQPAKRAAKPTSTPLPAPVSPPVTQTTETTPTVSTPGRTPVRPSGRRTITRYAFEFFQDQLETLKHWSLEAQIRGDKGSMSQMVREALDAYISRKLNSEVERTSDETAARTPVRPDGGGES